MFNLRILAQRGLLHHWRSNLAIALGVAAATAVLTGALIVGDSMRGSLRRLTLERLGAIDELLTSEGFFRQQLADDLQELPEFKAAYDRVLPVILFPGGTVEAQAANGTRRATRVTVIGATRAFPDLDSTVQWNVEIPTGQQVIINQALADDLGISTADVNAGQANVALRIPKRDQLPADSSLGKKSDLIESLVDLKVAAIVPTAGLGRFGLHPSQADPLNIYVPIELLQEALSRTVLQHKSTTAQANMLLLSGARDSVPTPAMTEALNAALKPAVEDFGLSLKRVTRTFEPDNADAEDPEIVFDYWTLASDRLVINDSVAAAIQKAFPDAKPVFTYLANEIQVADGKSKPGIPFSMVAAIDFDEAFAPVSAHTNQPIAAPGEKEIVLTSWAAEDLQAKVGDKIGLTFFEPESKGGKQVERSVQLKVSAIAKLVKPDQPPEVRRRRPMVPAVFTELPAVINDPQLTPAVPGLTDAKSIESWDLPFETADKIRSQDDDYWNMYRTTPKAFVSLETGQRLWDSRYGRLTSFRIPVAANGAERTGDQIRDDLAAMLIAEKSQTGLELVTIKRRALAASSGSTPFDVLFLALSMFVIASALILVSLLFRLALQQRASELGVLSAVGLGPKQIRNAWLLEMLGVAAIGAWLGVQLGVGYAAFMIHGLSTWWVGAISRPFLKLQIGVPSLLIGVLSGIAISLLTILWAFRSARKQSVRSLLAGQVESTGQGGENRRSRFWLVILLFVTALVLSVGALSLAGEAQAGAFMGAGFFVLSALLLLVFQRLRSSQNVGQVSNQSPPTGIADLAKRAASRNPLRSTLTIGLVAVASFLIAAVSSFRLTPNEAGTAGFDWIATSSQPLAEPLELDAPTPRTFSFRYKSGEDASCNNLYQSTQPQVLGVGRKFMDSFDPADEVGFGTTTPFAWGGTIAGTDQERANPWQLFSEVHAGTKEDPIPVIIDKNTANYSLKIYLPGTNFKVDYDSGETVHFVAVGFLANTILQGSLITSEENFLNAFPSVVGYQYFLIREDEGKAVAASLEEQYSDYGFDARSADAVLAGFMTVQNTYLSTFQMLGGLGLLLGTFGLAAVQLRSVLERKRELALMRAIGFRPRQLASMILRENIWLLLMGLGIGLVAALFTTLPHWLTGNASVPWLELIVLFALILIVGLLASWLASRSVARMPLLESLRT